MELHKGRKIIGIIGGMGPLATCDLFKKIIDFTKASCDQDYIRVYIDNNTNIPDRTEAILHGGADPVPELVRSGILLEGMGADVLIMPCNTAHYFYDKITPFLHVPLLHMPKETAKCLHEDGIKTVGLLATDGTIKSRVYHDSLEKYGIKVLTPTGAHQQAVMDIIYKGVKAGRSDLDTKEFSAAMDELFDSGAQKLILGCTELPVAFDMYHFDRPAIDATSVLAKAAIKFVDENLLK